MAEDEVLHLSVELTAEVRERLKRAGKNQAFKSICSRKENQVEPVIERLNSLPRVTQLNTPLSPD